MSAEQLITDHLDVWTSAITHKSGRGAGKGRELTGIKKLRELILELAVRGKLVEQDPNDEPASVLLERIAGEKARLVKEGKIKKPKKLSSITQEEEPFELPSGWVWSRLPETYYSISPNGKNVKSSEVSEEGSFPVVDQGKSHIAGYHNDESLVIRIPNPVIVFGDHTTARKYIDFDFVAGADGTKILCPVLLEPKYFHLSLLQYDLENRGYARHFKILNEQLFAIPPSEEQHRIVARVDELMTLCDRLEEKTGDQLEAHEVLVDTLLDALTRAENADEVAAQWARLAEHFDTLFTTDASIDKLKQAILQLAVMGRLVEQDPNDEPASVLLEKIAEEKARLVEKGKIKKPKKLPTITKQEEPFLVPNNWAWSRIGKISLSLDYGTSEKSFESNDGYPVLKMGDIKNGKVTLGDQKRIPFNTEGVEKLLLKNGELLYNRTNSAELVGKTGIYIGPNDQYSFASYLIRIRLDQSLVLPNFVNIFMNSPRFRLNEIEPHLKQQCGQANVNGTIMSKMRIALPPVSEQYQILEKVDEFIDLCDQLKARLSDAGETRTHLAEAVVMQAVE